MSEHPGVLQVKNELEVKEKMADGFKSNDHLIESISP